MDKRADCSLTVHYTKVWVESGLDRYRMWLITAPRNDKHLQLYCEAGSNAFYLTNLQCFWGSDGKYYIDASVARGPAGHKYVYLVLTVFLSDLQSLGPFKTHTRRCVTTLNGSLDAEQTENSSLT
jgi:hypothetical protein